MVSPFWLFFICPLGETKIDLSPYKTLKDPLISDITESPAAEAWARISCWQLHPHFMQFPPISCSFLSKINPLPFGNTKVAGQPEQEMPPSRSELQRFRTMHWSWAEERTHTLWEHTHPVAFVCAPHTHWKLAEGHTSTENVSNWQNSHNFCDFAAWSLT